MLAAYFPRKDKLDIDQMMTPQEYLAQHRILGLYGVIDEYLKRYDAFGPTMIMDALMALDRESHEPIKLILDTPGGYINIGFSLLDTIRSIKSPVWTIGRNVQSMGVLLLAAGQTGNRYVYPNSRIMLHLPFSQISGNTEDIKIQQREMECIKERMVDLLIDYGAVKKKKEILKDIDREMWMSAQESIDYGICDKIVKPGDV